MLPVNNEAHLPWRKRFRFALSKSKSKSTVRLITAEIIERGTYESVRVHGFIKSTRSYLKIRIFVRD
jgi:hypothetical protein